jgi:DNA-binding NtrC family response regulator
MPRLPSACAWPDCARPPASKISITARRAASTAASSTLSPAGRWLHEHNNILILGPTGTGKSFVACTLGNQAARLLDLPDDLLQ